MIRYVLAVLVLALAAGDLFAGPILDRLRARRQKALAPVPAANCPNVPAAVVPASPVAPTPATGERQFVPGTASPPAVRYEWRSVCDGGRCRLVLVPIAP